MTKLIIKGKKVILRPLKIEDAKNFCKWLGDPDVTKFLSVHGQPAPSLKEEKEWIKDVLACKKDVRLAIDTIDGKHIGIVSLRNIKNQHRRAEFGIIIGDQEYWGQGYGTEAGYLMVKHGFEKLKLHRIFLSCIAFNIRGLKSYEKIGFKLEGRLRDANFVNGHFHDMLRMAMLEGDWKRCRARKS